jgi:ribosome-binding protein aMBF1 (putative translation factor)
MAKIRSKHNGNRVKHQTGAVPPSSEQSEPLFSTRSSVPPMPHLVWDRLNARLARASSAPVSSLQQRLLQELGSKLRNWRLRQNSTRQALASTLQMEVGLLLVLEQGLAQPSDVTADHLTTLASLLTEQDKDGSLQEVIEQYLTSLT